MTRREPGHFEIAAEGVHDERHVGLDGAHRRPKTGAPADRTCESLADASA